MREMKDSGVEWLGEVPAGWGVVPVKRVAVLKHGSDPKTAGDTPVYASGQSAFKTCGEFKEGPSVLLGRKGTLNCPQYVEGRFWNVDTAFDVSMRSGDMALKYFFYAISSVDIGDLSTNTAKPSMTQGAWCSVKLPNPPIDEQRRIADFLDEKCVEIDRAVSAAEQSIEEYKAYKNSIVFQAVTKGLDSNVPTADSGLDWIGRAPKHWDVLEQKWLMRKKKLICEKWQGESVLSLTTSGVVVRDVESGKGKFPATFDGYQYIDAGNLVLCLFDIDVTPRCTGLARQSGVISPAYSQFAMLPGAEARFYDYYFRAMDDRKLYLGLTSTMRHSFTADAFGLIRALRPSAEEQLRIANYLDAKTAEVDRLVSSKRAIIADLKAYKQSLIYETVTGKREV